jgi:hypothetical protein
MTSKTRHTTVVVSWDIQPSAWEARSANRHGDTAGGQDKEMQVHPVGTATVNGRTYAVYKDTVEDSIFSDPLLEMDMFIATFIRSGGEKA